ncbi:MAG: carbohydrate porin [Acidobacteria bacterium]|nr:carbohydrate porin [Acidobacteriota bacterium]
MLNVNPRFITLLLTVATLVPSYTFAEVHKDAAPNVSLATAPGAHSAVLAPTLNLSNALSVSVATNLITDFPVPANGTFSQDIPSPLHPEQSASSLPQKYNFHIQYTLTGMGYTSFAAQYSNPAYLWPGTGSSLPTQGQARETQSLDAYFGYRLGADTEFHLDTLMWQGYGLNNTYGINDFPDGEAFKVGVRYPHFSVVRFFLRKTINLDGQKGQESVDDDLLTVRGKQDSDRIVITAGRFSAKDIFDNNAYANDPREQFMNWALMADAAWDYPADALGFTTGVALEWHRSRWTLRYGWLQMSKYRNQFTAESLYLTIPSEPEAGDGKIFQDWGMVTELEHRHSIRAHAGTIRFLAFDDRANMGSYKAAVALANDPATLAVWGTPAKFLASANGVTGGIDSTHALRNTWGFGFNMEQEIANNIGVFSRIGRNSGQNESFEFTDANWTATFGTAIKGATWRQPDDVVGAAFIASGISKANQTYLADGGIGILTGDGALSYGSERNVELYYDHKLSKYVHTTLDYQLVDDPAFNKARGPVPGIFAFRLHFER